MVSKVFEKVILHRMQKEIVEKNFFHETQRGFRQNKSTLHNINDLLMLIKKAKTHVEAERKRTKVVKDRARVFLIFFDFKKRST